MTDPGLTHEDLKALEDRYKGVHKKDHPSWLRYVAQLRVVVDALRPFTTLEPYTLGDVEDAAALVARLSPGEEG